MLYPLIIKSITKQQILITLPWPLKGGKEVRGFLETHLDLGGLNGLNIDLNSVARSDEERSPGKTQN